MIYVSIDIETTGLDPVECQTIEFGAVVEDTSKDTPLSELPIYNAVVRHPVYTGQPFALGMNARIFNLLGSETKHTDIHFVNAEHLAKDFYEWLLQHYPATLLGRFTEGTPIKMTVAGKNFATFDKLFIERLPDWKKYFIINQRIIDPAVLFVDWDKDFSLPNFSECKKRAGLDGIVTHCASEDALDVVRMIRNSRPPKPKEFFPRNPPKHPNDNPVA